MSSTALPLIVTIRIENVIDQSAVRRLQQLLFAPSTGVVVAASTGVAS
jgi:hypothetical protein